MYLFSLRRLLKRVFKYGGIAVLVAAVPLTAISLTLRWQAERALEAKVQELREAGVPTTPEELNAMYRPAPDIPDAGETFAAIAQSIDTYDCDELSKEQESLLPIMGPVRECAHSPLPPESLQQLKVTLVALAAPLAQAESLLDSRPVLFRKFEFPLGDIGHHGDTRAVIRLMSMAGLLAAEEHDANRVGLAWLRGWRVGEVMQAEPGLLPALTHSGNAGVMLENMRIFLNRIAVPAHNLQQWQAALLDDKLGDRLKRIVHGEVVYTLEAHHLMQSDVRARLDYFLEGFDYPDTLFDASFAFAKAEILAESTQATASLLGTYLEYAKLTSLSRNELSKRFYAMYYDDSRDGVHDGESNDAQPNYVDDHFDLILHREEPKRLLAVLACGVELYIAEHGAPPESLDALTEAHVPQAIIDPNTGKAFLYERTPQGYVLRSEAAKECGKFDAEEEEDCYNECTLHDLVLEVRRPELAVALAG